MAADEKQRQIDEHAEALARGAEKFDAINARLDEVVDEQRKQRKVMEEVRDVLDVYGNVKGFVKVMTGIAWLAKWIAIVGGVIGAAWYFIRTGEIPSKP